MKKSIKIIVIIVPTALFALSVPWLLLSLAFPDGNSDWTMECGSGFNIFYDDATKHDISTIKTSLIDSFDVTDASQYFPVTEWWDYVKISKPDAEGKSHISIPTAIFYGSELHTKIVDNLGKINGITKVEGTQSWCI